MDRPLAKSESLPALSLSADGSRLLLATGWAGRGGVSLLDASSGTVLAELAPAEPKVFVTARFLPGGEVVVVTGRQERLILRLFDREGNMTRELPLGTGSMARIGSPWSTHELPVRVSHRVEEGRRVTWQSELRLLDLATGGVRVLGGDYAPLAGASPWLPADDRLQAGAPASRLFHEPDGSLVRLGVDGVPERVLPSAG